MNAATHNAALVLVTRERERQEAKWANTCSDPSMEDGIRLAVLAEEFGEVGKALLEGDVSDVATELVHVAAVAVAWLEGIEGRGW